jgi:hypothetical protein
MKTVENNQDVFAFIEQFAQTDSKKRESFELIPFFEKVTGFPPKMWGKSIIGFGKYHYKYASGHEGDFFLVGFSPRKAAFSLYVFTGLEEHEPLLEGLGKFKRGKGCIYVNKLSDIRLDKLETLIRQTANYFSTKYEKV